jgi:hypothetical protein
MSISNQNSLLGIYLKMERSRQHLDQIILLDRKYEWIDCKVVFKEDHEKGIGYFVINLPKPPIEISTLVGDCLHNLRPILDYLIWQMVISNPPNKPDRRNMFPICNTLEDFNAQIRGKRLSGITNDAIEIIKQFQPFNDLYHPLSLLNELYNADKHRNLNFTIAVASDLYITLLRNNQIISQIMLGNDEVRDGAIFGDVGIPLSALSSQLEVKIHSKAEGFIAFENLDSRWGDAMCVVDTLELIRDFIGDEIVPALEPFIRR